MKKIVLCISMFSLLLSYSFVGKKDPNAPKKLKKSVLLLNVDLDNRTIEVDMGGTKIGAIQKIEYSPLTNIIDKKKNSISITKLRSGHQISIAGYQKTDKITLTEIKLLTNTEKWSQTVKGKFEVNVNGEVVIDGRKVELDSGAEITDIDGSHIQSIHDLEPGNFVRAKGKIRSDGILYLQSGEVRESVMNPNTRSEIMKLFDDNIIEPNSDFMGFDEHSHVEIGGEELNILHNADVHEYVRTIGMKMVPDYMKDVSVDDSTKVDFRFYVIDDENLNAYAMHNGVVIITKGMLSFLDNEAQLAAVLGHEIAHVSHEHAEQKMKSKKTAKGIKSFLWDIFHLFDKGRSTSDELELIGETADMATDIASNVYSKNLENQADRVGLSYLIHEGYDPREAPALWQKMAERHNSGVSKTETASTSKKKPKKNIFEETKDAFQFVTGFNSIFSTHASAVKRYKNLNQIMAISYRDLDYSGLKVNQKEYGHMKEKLDIITTSTQNSKPFFPRSPKTSSTETSKASSIQDSQTSSTRNSKTSADETLDVLEKLIEGENLLDALTGKNIFSKSTSTHPYDNLKVFPKSFTLGLLRVQFSNFEDVETFSIPHPYSIDRELEKRTLNKATHLINDKSLPIMIADYSGMLTYQEGDIDSYNRAISRSSFPKNGSLKYYFQGKLEPLASKIQKDTALLSSETVSREIEVGKIKKVVNGKKVKVPQTEMTTLKIDKYYTTAKVPFTMKSVIRDQQTDKIVWQKDITYQYVLKNEFILYEGNKKALTKKERRLSRNAKKRLPSKVTISKGAYSKILDVVSDELVGFMESH